MSHLNLDAQHKLSLNLKYSSLEHKAKIKTNDFYYLGDGLYSTLNFKISNLQYFNQMCLSREEASMKRGSGKKVKGIYGFSNQGYIRISHNKNILKHNFTYGRAYVEHGFGKSGQLLISKWSRPFDQISWNAKYKGINATMTGIQLDEIENNKRYFSLHTIDFDIKENFTISFGESAIYAGENRNIELQYFNPTLFWIPVRENQPHVNQANGFLYSGIKFEDKNYAFWVEFLLDDFQIDSEIKEPSTYAYLLGVNVNKRSRYISKFWFEYCKVINQTYQTHGAFSREDYTHRGYPIGHYLGNDFDYITFELNYNRIKYDLIPSLNLSIFRDGYSGMERQWNDYWNDNGYSAKSNKTPSQPYENVVELEVYLEKNFENKSKFQLGWFHQVSRLQGIEDHENYLMLRVFYVLDFPFNY